MSRWIFGLIVSLFAVSTADAATAEDWLARMATGLAQTDYEGTLVYADGTRMETLKVFRSAKDGRERLVVLTGPHREIVRDGDMLICIGDGDPTVAYEGSPLARWLPAVDAAQSGMLTEYALVLGGVERIAGYDTQELDLRARDDLRYSYRLWLEKQTGLPLKVILVDGGNAAAPLEQLMFTAVTVGVPPAASDLLPSVPNFTRHFNLSSPAAPTMDLGWVVRNAPTGFALRSQQRTSAGDHLVYSDGLASVSIYIEPMGDKVAEATASRAGAVHARALMLGNRRVYVIGKAPAQTIERFARGVAAEPKH